VLHAAKDSPLAGSSKNKTEVSHACEMRADHLLADI